MNKNPGILNRLFSPGRRTLHRPHRGRGFMQALLALPLLGLSLVAQAGPAPLVAVIGYDGGNNTTSDPDGFSIVAVDTVPDSTTFYFTDREFDNTTGLFNTAEGVFSYTPPPGGLAAGDVVVFYETGPSTDILALTCSLAGSCGSVSVNGIVSLATATPDHIFFEFAPGNRGSVIIDNLEVPSFYTVGVSGATLLSTTQFVFSSGAAPVLTLGMTTPASADEDATTTYTYTFTLDSAAPAGGLVINFSVGGTADFSTDYTQSGATTFTASGGTITIPGGSTQASLTIDPSSDTTVEADENVTITAASGTGYDLGATISHTATILNDDANASAPLVAITGLNHMDPDGFSFVALLDIPENTVVYFTENDYDASSLTLTGSDSVLKWT
ncbi:MAG: hypothetical protein P8Z31_03510, partial [Gammaproteobacteria bacterium]